MASMKDITGRKFGRWEAALAYNKRAVELFGEFACLNALAEVGNGT